MFRFSTVSHILGLMLITFAGVEAAPSVQLEAEFFVPLESDPARFALTEIETGQVRVFEVDGEGRPVEQSESSSHLTGVSSVTSGLLRSGVESVILASELGNQIRTISEAGGNPGTIPRLFPGPHAVAVIREGTKQLAALAVGSAFGEAGPTIELVAEVAENPSTVDAVYELEEILDLQPLYLDSEGRRFLAALVDDPSAGRNLAIFEISGNNLNQVDEVELREGARIATNLIGSDGRLMVAAYVPGKPGIQFFTVDAVAGNFEEIGSDETPFDLAAVVAVQPPGHPPAVALLAADGSVANLYSVDSGRILRLLESFTPTAKNRLTGLLPLASHGLIALQRSGGLPGVSETFVSYAYANDQWELSASGSLGGYAKVADNFATLFWYFGNPLLDPSAELVSVESVDSWTRPDDKLDIPASILSESYLDADAGLQPVLRYSPSNPVGADHLFTNQLAPSVSLAALRGELALFEPQLRVSPVSGSYDAPIDLVANYDSDLYELRYREERAGTPWRVYDQGVPVAYDSDWLFYLNPLAGGTPGSIIRYSYSFPNGIHVDQDSDSDGVPDYVEQYYDMNPQGGADHDGDGQSDLEEILAGTDPNDASDLTARDPEADLASGGVRGGINLGDGLIVFAQAKPGASGFASPGTRHDLRSASGALLQSGELNQLEAPASLVGEYAAALKSDRPVDVNGWQVLQTPYSYNLGTGPSPSRNGVEQLRVLSLVPPPPPTVNVSTLQTGLVADATGWINAARIAYASYDPVTSITPIRPKHNSLSVAAEAALFNALSALDPVDQTSLAVPATAAEFSLFSGRSKDAERTPVSEAMLLALRRNGYDFSASIEAMTSALDTAAFDNARGLGLSFRSHYLAESGNSPTMPLPLDALRALLHGGAVPSEYVGVDSAASLATARGELLALAGLGDAYRPTETWAVSVLAPDSTRSAAFTFERTDGQEVAFFDRLGERFYFAQGLGLGVGTTVSVTGYTDLAPVGADALPAMEVVSVNFVTMPAPSETDTDGNLIADDWESYFFGGAGIEPHDSPTGSDYSYLQYFLEGIDPRSDETPTGEVLDLSLPAVEIVSMGDGTFAIEWDWPDSVANRFRFAVEQTTDLNTGFGSELSLGAPSIVGPNRYRMRLGAGESAPDSNFFRVTLRLD